MRPLARIGVCGAKVMAKEKIMPLSSRRPAALISGPESAA